jgi:hypothetical protein
MQVTIFTLILLIIGSVSGCDYNKKSKELPPEKKIELAEKCSKAGKAYFDEFLRHDFPEGYLWDDPEYHYSSRLNTCLIHIRYIKLGIPSSSQRNQVIDIFSNKAVLYGWFERDGKTNVETPTDPPHGDVQNFKSIEYFKQKDKLFRE